MEKWVIAAKRADFNQIGQQFHIDPVIARLIRNRDVIGWMNRQTAQKVAVDIPSGICSATGKVLGIAFQAELTVSMACQKRGCALYPGQICAGEVVPVTIGIDPEYFFEQKSVCMTYDKKELGNLLPERKEDSHKGSFGSLRERPAEG